MEGRKWKYIWGRTYICSFYGYNVIVVPRFIHKQKFRNKAKIEMKEFGKGEKGEGRGRARILHISRRDMKTGENIKMKTCQAGGGERRDTEGRGKEKG